VVTLCALCYLNWSLDGKYLAIQFHPTIHSDETFLLPVSTERGLPDLPPEGLAGPEDSREAHRVTVVPKGLDSEFGPEKYSYTITNVRRNIYRMKAMMSVLAVDVHRGSDAGVPHLLRIGPAGRLTSVVTLPSPSSGDVSTTNKTPFLLALS
jgi:hypothetical protein